jgi:hypothetical protein
MANERFASNLTNQPGGDRDAETSLPNVVVAGLVLLVLGLVLVWLFFLFVAKG